MRVSSTSCGLIVLFGLATAVSAGACGQTATAITTATAPTSIVTSKVTQPLSSAPAVIPGYDQDWQLTVSVTQLSGTGCVIIGADAATGDMKAARQGNVVKFLYWARNWPTDSLEYAVNVDATGAFAV